MTSPKTFMQFNCNGIQSSKAELQDFLVNNQVKIVAIQETKLSAKSKNPSFTDYNLIRKDRPTGRGGGLAFLVHHSVRFTNLDVTALLSPNDVTTELQGISALVNNSNINVCNASLAASSTPR